MSFRTTVPSGWMHLAMAVRVRRPQRLIARRRIVVDAGPHEREEEEEHRQADEQAALPEVREHALIGQMPDVDQHDDEEEEHHDAARVDEDLHGPDELRSLHHKENCHAEECEQKEQRRVHGVPHRHDEDRRRHRDRADDQKNDQGRTQGIPPSICFGSGSSGGRPAYSGRPSQYSSCCMLK